MRPDPESPKCYGNLSRYGSCVCSNATMTDINVTPGAAEHEGAMAEKTVEGK